MAETIFAPATAPGRAGIAVVRISGPAAADAVARLTGTKPPPPRYAARARFCDPASGARLDDGLCLWFPAPASFTGEDVAELHIHGGRASVAALTAALARIAGLRFAEPGEFTRRAFENGKLDLTAAEGLADLVDAETEAQRRQAARQLDGELGALYDSWRARLISALAHLEAVIDFPDEDLPAGVRGELERGLDALVDDLSRHLDDGGRGERVRDGISIAIVGPPNVGKSSLLNALARRDAAIVSEAKGTTRDVIECHLDLGGYPAIVADTAGLREAGGAVEREGVARALARAEAADIRIVMFDASVVSKLERMAEELVDGDAVVVANKVDLLPERKEITIAGRRALAMSVTTGEGVATLLRELSSKVEARYGLAEQPALTRARHRAALEQCRDAVARGRGQAAVELMAEDLRLAARALGRITGRVDVEEILDVVFRDFCIGK